MPHSLANLTLDKARRAVGSRLNVAGIDTPDLDARLLIGHAFGLDLTGLIAHGARVLSDDDAGRIDAFVVRRLAGEPIARITGMKEFWGLSLRLSQDTLVPRPDTETLVEAALKLIDRHAALAIADLGTGSGAILLALLSECPNAFGIGTDISVGALQTARDNARHNSLADRAAFVACDYASALKGRFDLIVSNPPYIRSTDIDSLEIDVRDHDPMQALDGGADGLDAYRVIASDALRLLKPAGVVVVEVGHDQSDDVQGILSDAGLAEAAAPTLDLAGIARAISARNG